MIGSRLSSQLVAWFLTIALVPVALVAFMTYRVAESTIQREVSQNLESLANRHAERIALYFRDRDRDVLYLARTPEIVNALERGAGDTALSDSTLSFMNAFDYREAVVVSRAGIAVYAAGGATTSGENLRSAEFAETELARTVDRAARTLEVELSDYRIDSRTGVPSLFIAAPVLREGRLLGVVALKMDYRDTLRVVSDSAGLGNSGETIVAIRDGSDALIVSPLRDNPEAAFKTRVSIQDHPDAPLVEAVQGRRDAGFRDDFRGVPVFAVWRYLPSVRWGIVVKIDRDEVLGTVSRLRMLSITTAIVTAGIVCAIALLLARSITDPISQLSVAAHRIADGDLEGEIPISGKTEIADLGRSFRSMAVRLNETIGDLRRTSVERERAAREALDYAQECQLAEARLEEYSHTLEQKVAERTAEIRERNRDLETAMGQVKQAQDKLILQEKMASLGQLTAGIAHEIKNPLNFVTNLSTLSRDIAEELRELLKAHAAGLPPDFLPEAEVLIDDIEESMEKINEHGKRADSIVRNMLLHSRGRAGEWTKVDLNAMLREYVNLAFHGIRARDKTFNLKMEYELEENLGPIEAIPQDLSRVILNIAANACYALNNCRHLRPGGWMPTMRIRSRSDGNRVEFRIRDNGTGIASSDIDKIFQPFYTTKPPGEGTGLGLSISYEIIVTKHGGEMLVFSEEGIFCEFVMILPRNSPQARKNSKEAT